jgi:hypothetical protein
LPSSLKSAEGCRALAGLVNRVSSGQKIGHIIGWPARLICCQPPASVASLVVHQTPVRAPGRSSRCWCETSSTIDSTVVLAKLFCAPAGRQVGRGPVLRGGVDDRQQRQVDIERVGDAPGPDPRVTLADRLAGPALQHQGALRAVLARLVGGQHVQPQVLPPVGARLGEGHPVGQSLVVGVVQVDLELVAALRAGCRAR